MPGMLPVPNRECIRQAVRTGMAIEAQINTYSRFDRKNYFYADLPQGYQISQLYHPIVREGSLTIEADEKAGLPDAKVRSDEPTSELQSLLRNSYAVFCLKKTQA